MNDIKHLEYADGRMTKDGSGMVHVAKYFFENLFSSQSRGGDMTYYFFLGGELYL